MPIETYVSIITSNVNGINAGNQKIQTDWMYKKQDTYMLPIGDSLQT